MGLWVRRKDMHSSALGENMQNVVASFTLAQTDMFKFFENNQAPGTVTITLPNAGNVIPGSWIKLYNFNSQTFGITCAANQLISNSGTNGTSASCGTRGAHAILVAGSGVSAGSFPGDSWLFIPIVGSWSVS